VRQCGPVDPLSAQDVDIILLDELLWREGFRWAEHHMTGVVNDDIEVAGVGNDTSYAGIGRRVRQYIELNRGRSAFCSLAHAATAAT
jgi:hypothetical protein